MLVAIWRVRVDDTAMASVERVSFDVNGVEVVGLLHLPDGDGPHIGAVVDGPLTSVKEQVGSNYARALSERGIAVLAFDHRHFGESGGEPRQYEHPPRKVEDVRAALGFLQGHDAIDGDRLAVVGVCAGAGYVSRAVADDPRVKAFAAVAGFFHDADKQREWMGDKFAAQIARGRQAREKYEQSGEVEMIPAVGKEGEVAMPLDDAFDYYGTERGAVPNYHNAFAVMSREHTLPWDAQAAASYIEVPTLIIHADAALAPALARKFYESLGGPKREIWLDAKCQTDFYDNPERIASAADAIAQHVTVNV